MWGIYVHIPFCRQACRYCDFFFSVSLRFRDEYVNMLVEEIKTRAEHMQDRMILADKKIGTLYFGGGTPSLLDPAQLDRIMDTLYSCFSISDDAEVTIECNPDDMSSGYGSFLKRRGFNRLSIGIQSFHEKDLQLLHRSHTADQALQCLDHAASVGFDNLNLDLIYGIPGQTSDMWEENISRALSLPIEHLSAYHLAIEPGTVFDHWLKKGRLKPVEEEVSIAFFRSLRQEMTSNGYVHYEISNFARNGRMSAHNLIYWNGNPYLGFGPSSHSYDGSVRFWNVSSLKKYMEGISGNQSVSEKEQLTDKEKYHDYLITSLRTHRGADPDHIMEEYGEEFGSQFLRGARKQIDRGFMHQEAGRFIIDPEWWLITDHILRELFID